MKNINAIMKSEWNSGLVLGGDYQSSPLFCHTLQENKSSLFALSPIGNTGEGDLS